MKRLRITDLSDIIDEISAASHGLTFRRRQGICFLRNGLYHYIVCTHIFRYNGCYAFFYTPIAPRQLPSNIPEGFPGMNPSCTAWNDPQIQHCHLRLTKERTDLCFEFAETNVQYSLFPWRRRTCVCIGPAR